MFFFSIFVFSIFSSRNHCWRCRETIVHSCDAFQFSKWDRNTIYGRLVNNTVTSHPINYSKKQRHKTYFNFIFSTHTHTPIRFVDEPANKRKRFKFVSLNIKWEWRGFFVSTDSRVIFFSQFYFLLFSFSFCVRSVLFLLFSAQPIMKWASNVCVCWRLPRKRYGNGFNERRNRFHSTFSLLFRTPTLPSAGTLTGWKKFLTQTIIIIIWTKMSVPRVKWKSLYISINSWWLVNEEGLRSSRFPKKLLLFSEVGKKEEIIIIKKNPERDEQWGRGANTFNWILV